MEEATAAAGRGRDARRAPPPKAAPPPPAAEDFDRRPASDFSVEGVTPLAMPATTDEADGARRDRTRRRSPRWIRPNGGAVREIRAGRGRGHRDHRGAPRSPARTRNARRRRSPLQRILSLPVLIVAAGGDPARRAAMARDGGAAFSADRLAVLHDRDAGQSARPDLPGREEPERIPRRCHGAGGRRRDREPDAATRSKCRACASRLRNGIGHEVYAWTALPTRPLLGSGDGLPFRTRLASPPPDGRDVIVRFFNRRDAGARHTVRVSLADFR